MLGCLCGQYKRHYDKGPSKFIFLTASSLNIDSSAFSLLCLYEPVWLSRLRFLLREGNKLLKYFGKHKYHVYLSITVRD